MTEASSEPFFKSSFFTSLLLHLLLFVILAVRAVFYAGEPLKVEQALRVDMVALPTKNKIKQLDPTPAPPEPEPVKPPAIETPAVKQLPPPIPSVKTPDPNKISLVKTKHSQADALKRLEALNHLENLNKAASKPASSAPIKGNKVAQGNSLTGLEKLDYDAYLEGLDDRVKKHWALPEWLSNGNFKAQIVVWLDASGNITKKKMVRSSGNQVFDQKAMEAVERAAPFPKPPPQLANIIAVEGFRLGFPD